MIRAHAVMGALLGSAFLVVVANACGTLESSDSPGPADAGPDQVDDAPDRDENNDAVAPACSLAALHVGSSNVFETTTTKGIPFAITPLPGTSTLLASLTSSAFKTTSTITSGAILLATDGTGAASSANLTAVGFADGAGVSTSTGAQYWSVVYGSNITYGGHTYPTSAPTGTTKFDSLVIGASSDVRHIGGDGTSAWQVAPYPGEGVYVAGDLVDKITLKDKNDTLLRTVDAAGRQVFVGRIFTAATTEKIVASTQAGATKHVDAIAVDTGGNLYITGQYQGDEVPFGTGAPATDNDVFVTSFDKDLAVRWTKDIGGVGPQEAFAMTPMKDGVLVAGTFEISLGADSKTLLTAKGKADIFLLRLDTAGNVVWAKAFGGSEDDKTRSIAYDPMCDRIFVAGTTASGDLDFGGGRVGDGTTSTSFVVALDGAGAFVDQMSSTSVLEGGVVTVDAAGRLYWSSTLAGKLTIGKTTIGADGVGSMFVVRLDR